MVGPQLGLNMYELCVNALAIFINETCSVVTIVPVL
jgi:hypothetical protein